MTKSEIDIVKLKAKIESLLYCLPYGMTTEKLTKKLRIKSSDITKKVLFELQKDYADRKAGLLLVNEKNIWRFKVPDEHTTLVKEAAEPDFDKSILQTLAYVAWRGGSRQCDTVRVRSNKAYRHIKLLIEHGFIESSKSGLSKWLAPTKKFYEYFNIKKGDKLKLPEKFKLKEEIKDSQTSSHKIHE